MPRAYGEASLIVLARQNVLRGLLVPPAKVEGAERRQALGCSGTRRRANNVGPQAPAGALRRIGDARLSALHRGDCWLRTRLGQTFGRCT